MSLDGTYAGLQASVAEFLNRAELLATIPDFIKLAETQLNRKLRAADMITSATLSVSTSSAALPADFNGMVSFELPSGAGTPLRYVKPEEVRALRQTLYTTTGAPKVWSIAGTNLETAPPPDQAYLCLMLYYARIPALTNSNTSNWLLTKHPDAYLYGALLQSAPYLKDDARLQTWAALYEKAIDDIAQSDGRVAFGHGLASPFRGAALPSGTSPMAFDPVATTPQ